MSAVITLSCLKQMFNMATSSIKDGHLQVPQLRPKEMGDGHLVCTSSRDTYECSNQICRPNLTKADIPTMAAPKYKT